MRADVAHFSEAPVTGERAEGTLAHGPAFRHAQTAPDAALSLPLPSVGLHMEQCVASGSVNRLPHPSEGTSVTSSALPISLCHKAALCSRRAVLELFPVPGVLRNSGTEIAVPGRTVVPVAHKTLPEASLPTFFFFKKKRRDLVLI